MAQIFISYSRKDENFTRKLAASLSDLGADIWIDVEDIPAGMNWSTAIQDGLNLCEVMLVIVSPDSMVSKNVEVEWQYFLDKSKLIIPLFWKPSEVHFQISRLQYVDFNAQDYLEALKQLHIELKRHNIQLNPISTLTNFSDRSTKLPLPKPPSIDDSDPMELQPIGVASYLIVFAVIAVAILFLSGTLKGVVGQAPAQSATLLPLESDDAVGYINRGNDYFNLGEFESAIDDYEHAIELDPENALAYNNRGNAYSETGNYNAALADYNRAIAHSPDYATAYENRGTAYLNLGYYDAAIGDFDRAIEMNHASDSAYQNRGLAYFHLEEYATAIANYDIAISIEPTIAAYYWGRGNAFYELRAYETAVVNYREYQRLAGYLLPFMAERISEIEGNGN